MKAGTKVLTPDGPGTVVKSRNGVFIVWVYVKLSEPEWKGKTYKYSRESIKLEL